MKLFGVLSCSGISLYVMFILLTFGFLSGTGAFFPKHDTYTPWWKSLLGGWMFLIPLFIYLPILIRYKISSGVITRTQPENKENSEKATKKPNSAFAILCRFLVSVGIILYLQFIILGYIGQPPGYSIPEPWAGGIRIFGVILLSVLGIRRLLKERP